MKKRWIVIAATVVLVGSLGGAWYGTRGKVTAGGKDPAYELTAVKRGSIESVVSSSGTLSTVSTVSVLAQMSGRVEKVYADYNDHVKKGMVLASLNTDMLKLQEQESQASVRKAQAQYDLQLVDAENKIRLSEKGLLSDYDLKSSKASLEVLAAELAAAQSALKVVQTQLTQYALITSPVNGIVLDRDIEEGESVVEGTSANATSLFTLAEDLSQMEIKAEVDELDISSIRVGQEARFTVESWPGLTFSGKVRQIRLVPETTDNVVNYYVMIGATNPDGKLMPGMTATVQFIKERKSNVLLVPTAAFRFQPSGLSAQEIQKMIFLAGISDLPAEKREAAEKAYDEQVKSAAQAASADKAQSQPAVLTGMMMPGPWAQKKSSSAVVGNDAEGQNRKTLWYINEQGSPAVLSVATGASDATNTELLEADGLEGRQIIVKVKVE